MSNFCFNYLTQILYCIVFGVTFGAEIGMTAVVLIDVIGLSKFILGYGIQSFFIGIGLIIGPPIVGNSWIMGTISMRVKYLWCFLGALYEATGTHEAGFFFAGAMVLISGMLVLFLNGAKHLQEKEERVPQDNYSTSTIFHLLQSTVNLQSTIALQIPQTPKIPHFAHLGLPPSHCQRQNPKTESTRF